MPPKQKPKLLPIQSTMTYLFQREQMMSCPLQREPAQNDLQLTTKKKTKLLIGHYEI